MPATDSDRTRPTWRKKLLFSVVATLGALGLVELAARALELRQAPRAVDIGAGFVDASRVFVPVPNMPAFVTTAESKLQCFRAQRFAVQKPPGTLRVALLGGSSVYRLDSELRILERNLLAAFPSRFRRVEVLNCGGQSYGSHRLVRVAREVLGYDPDVVVYYEANNEFEEARQLQLASLDTVEVQRAMSRSAAVRWFRDRLVAREVERIQAERREEIAIANASPRFDVDSYFTSTPEQAETRMKAYRANLVWIVEECRRKGVPVILGTQPSNLICPFLGPEGRKAHAPVLELMAEARYPEAEALARRVLAESPTRHQASDVENGIVRQVSREHDVPLADVEAAVCAAEPHHIPGETYFVDHCHLNEEGKVILRRVVERALVEILLARAPGATEPTVR